MPPLSIKPFKRRVIDTKRRKKALFSCDRCKTKKIGCRRMINDDSRMDVDISIGCIACKKVGIECKTTIERKRKKHGPIENIGLHYECLLTLVDGIFPDKDVNNIDILISLGISLGISMPSRNGTKNQNENIKLNSVNSIDITDTSYPDNLNIINFTKNDLDNSKQNDCFVIDQENTPHYVGPLGAMNFLANTVNTMILKHNSESFWQKYQLINKNDIIISSKQERFNYNILKESYYLKFPYFYCISREESDFYVAKFFKKIHPFCFCFDYSIFEKKYDLFWKTLSGIDNSDDSILSNSFICSIYIIWIFADLLGSNFQPKRFFPFIKERLLEIIKICLSEMILTPSLDGIRCMFMLSLYFDVNCRKESGYLLLKLSCHQALAIGLGREYAMKASSEDQLVQSMKCLFWSLFQHESRISNQFGRSSSFSINEITTTYPKNTNVDETYNHFFIQNIELSKVLNKFLNFRSSIRLDNLLEEENIKRVLEFKNHYDSWYRQLISNYYLVEDESVGYKFHLIFQFHYYYISILFPYLLHCSKNISALKNSLVQKLVFSCIKSSMDVSRVLFLSKNCQFYFNILNSDMSLAHYASMSLILGFIILSHDREFCLVINNLNVELSQLKTSMSEIKQFNDECQVKLKGSSRKISRLVDVLLSEFQTEYNDCVDGNIFKNFTFSHLTEDFSLYSLDPEVPINYY